MDIVPDMDDLLNELEAAETSGKLTYDTNDPLVKTKMVLSDSSYDFIDECNSILILRKDHIEKSENIVFVDIEVKNVLADIISSVLLMENDSFYCIIEASENVAEQVDEIPNDSTGENSLHTNISGCKEDRMTDRLSDHPSSCTGLNQNDETNSGELDNKKINEMEVAAENYAEMEQYLDSCGANDASLHILEEPHLVSDMEVRPILPSTRAIEGEILTVDETNRKSSDMVDFDNDSQNFRSASKLEKEPDWKVGNAAVERIVKDVAVDVFGLTSCASTDGQSVYEMPHDTEENSSSDDAHKNVNRLMNSSKTLVGCSSSFYMQSFITKNDDEKMISAVEKSKDENESGRQANNDESEQQSELNESTIDCSVSECGIPVSVVDQVHAISVVSSTHDISRDPGVKYLTESERQLGKRRPVWIDDKETLWCMLCCIKFTVFVRRHHCRCCGRVLCARCTTQMASLPYVNNPKKEQRVCDPCFETLKRIEEFEKSIKKDEKAEANENRHSSDIAPPTKSVLKSKGKLENTISVNGDEKSLSNHVSHAGSSSKRSVTFRDGLPPGYSSNETQTPTSEKGSLKPKKHDSRRQHVSRRLLQLHVVDESVCLLPPTELICFPEELDDDIRRRSSEKSCLFLRSNDGLIVECDDIHEQITCLKNFELVEVMILRNLWCNIKLCKYEGRTVMCIVSSGMSFVGLDEIFLAFCCDAELVEFPIDYLWRIYEIFQNALSPCSVSSDEALGIRLAHNRVQPLNRTIWFASYDEPVSRDILLFRPSIQTFENLLVPSSPFLVAVFIYPSELIWANVLPQRLLFRIGLQASFYPTSIVNDFNREPVYGSVFDTSVLKMFNDFRNWRFRMTIISGSTLTIQDNNEALLIIPTWALDEIIKMINENKNMIAWGLDFSPDADSYLVCKQDNAGCFSSEIFTNGIENRKVTGASFVIIDGALKDSGEPFDVNILEDGVTIRFRSDIMESLIETLMVGQDFEQNSSTMKFTIKWNNSSYTQQLIGGLVSPIDNRSLMGCYQYGLKKSRILSSSYAIPNQLFWSLRLVSVYNVSRGRFVQRVQSKVFSVSEQVVVQIAATLAPFVASLVQHDLRHIFLRIRVTTEDAEYKAQPWPGMEKEFAAWLDFVDYQVVPGLFSICSYATVGFHAELHMALISVRPNP